MWKAFIKDYLSFTKRDRVGALVLTALVFLVVLLPLIWPVKKPVVADRQAIEQLRKQVAGLQQQDSATGVSHAEETGLYVSRAKEVHRVKPALFYFDPNTIDEGGWQRLGIRQKTAATIMHYLSKGGRFKKPEDLGKVYGLFKDDYERLLPFVAIAATAPAARPAKNWEEKKPYAVTGKPAYPEKRSAAVTVIDINAADTTAFIALPGIGSKLALRIVHFREKLGGFYAVQQVAETFGLPDTVFTKIQAFLQCNNPVVKQLNINTSDPAALKEHPYIRWGLANAMVQYRTQHGGFRTVDDLQLLAQMTPELMKKLRPYLVLQ